MISDFIPQLVKNWHPGMAVDQTYTIPNVLLSWETQSIIIWRIETQKSTLLTNMTFKYIIANQSFLKNSQDQNYCFVHLCVRILLLDITWPNSFQALYVDAPGFQRT